ncbi:MAG: thioredoxin family protein [Planctomycetota bacterium]|jgi:thioredoxin 1
MSDEAPQASEVIIALVAAVAAIIWYKEVNRRGPAETESGAASPVSTQPVQSDSDTAANVTGPLPRLLDLGKGTCVPCKMMKPILEELDKEYADRFTVEIIDLSLIPEATQDYGVQLIPTQIFFDASGKELFRHEGFMSREDILAKWSELGHDFSGQAKEGGV